MSEDQIKASVQDQFGRNAEKYVTSLSHAKGNDLALLVNWLNPQSQWTVLDIATGGGHVTKALSPHVGNVFSTDLTQEMLEAAKKYLDQTCRNIWYVRADAENLPFLKDSFDAVTCRIAAHHFPYPEKFVQEVSRVLKPGGKFLLIDNIAPEDPQLDQFMNTLEKLRDESHVRCYSFSEWNRWFEKANLVLQKSEMRRKTHDFPVWVRRTAESEQQVLRVENHVLSATVKEKEYFSIKVKDEKIISVQVDEWMVMLEKSKGHPAS